MKNDKAIEELIVCVEIPGNGGPILHREVGGIQQGVILYDGIENAIALQCRPARGQEVSVAGVGDQSTTYGKGIGTRGSRSIH